MPNSIDGTPCAVYEYTGEVSASWHPAASTVSQRKNWPSPFVAAGLPGAGGAESTHVQDVSLPPPPHCAVRRMAAMTPDGTLQLLAFEFELEPQPPRRKSPVREETPYPAPSSAALASATPRPHDGARETRKVEAVALNENTGYGAPAVLPGSSAVEVLALQVRRIGQSPPPEKPKGYGTVVLPHCRLHDDPADAGAEKVASGRKRRRSKKTSWCM
jgi:hypothetical protein